MDMFDHSVKILISRRHLFAAIWKVEYPACWATHTECSSGLSNSISYTQVGGIICGQLFLGFTADRIGRKLGSILTATTMLIGAILITASDGPTVNDQFIMFTIVQFIFGVGVGGEYPVASTSANERAESSSRLQNRRGQTVVVAV
jgi:MFS family permease